MGEAIWCNVRFKVPSTWNGPLARLRLEKYLPEKDWGKLYPTAPAFVKDAAAALLNGSDEPEDEEGEGWTIWSVDGEGNYGLYDDDLKSVLSWCAEHRVPYYATSDPKYDMSGEIDFFDGTDHRQGECGEDGSPKMSLSDWIRAKEHEDPLACVEAYFDLLTVPELAEIDISHLPATCPYDEEEDDEGVD